jgi:Cys-tRNA(Pro)/Cys-tRNA(Cys) deacylase
MKTNEKTNAMRKLDALGLNYNEYRLPTDEAVSGVQAAALLGVDDARLFKTLVTVGKSGAHYVFVIPAASELDLKKAAAAVGEKNIEMVKSKELLPLTGYVHGGCSPIGMKKQFKTVVHSTAADYESIIFSGGKIGFQIETPLDNLKKAIPLMLADVVKTID